MADALTKEARLRAHTRKVHRDHKMRRHVATRDGGHNTNSVRRHNTVPRRSLDPAEHPKTLPQTRRLSPSPKRVYPDQQRHHTIATRTSCYTYGHPLSSEITASHDPQSRVSAARSSCSTVTFGCSASATSVLVDIAILCILRGFALGSRSVRSGVLML